jgi:hypothetical protein
MANTLSYIVTGTTTQCVKLYCGTVSHSSVSCVILSCVTSPPSGSMYQMWWTHPMTSKKSWLEILAWGYVKGIMYVTGGWFGGFNTINHSSNIMCSCHFAFCLLCLQIKIKISSYCDTNFFILPHLRKRPLQSDLQASELKDHHADYELTISNKPVSGSYLMYLPMINDWAQIDSKSYVSNVEVLEKTILKRNCKLYLFIHYHCQVMILYLFL